MYAMCVRRTQLIQRRRCVTHHCSTPHSSPLLVDSRSACMQCVPGAACPLQKGACVLVHSSRWLWDTAEVESPDLKSRQKACNHLS
ncbi:unnamed protein product [Ectocarpus sp. 12 AP-2014]